MSAMHSDTFQKVNETSYSLMLGESSNDKPDLRILFSCPPGYPETQPLLCKVESMASGRRLPLDKLEKELARIAQDSIGMPAATTLLDHCQQFLESQLHSPVAKEEKVESNSVDVDPSIRIGRGVTRELFAAWKLQHTAEKQRVRSEKEKAAAGKLTGKQLWDSTLKNADWTLFAGEESAGIDYDEFIHENGDHNNSSGLQDPQ